MSDEQYGMQNGYAPIAHKVVCVDFDSTLYPWRPVYEQPDPLPGAPEAIRRLKAAGYRVVIFTSRLSPTWLASTKYTASDMLDHIEAVLKRDDIPFDQITAEKVPAVWYVDDRAIRFDGDWKPIADFILWKDSPSDGAAEL